MVDLRVDMDLGTGANDGTSWANAYQGKTGYESAVTAQTAGESIYAKDTVSSSASMTLSGLTTIAAAVNPVKCIGVVTGAADTVVKADIVLGFREGDTTKAYAQSGAEEPPNITTIGVNDIAIRGCLYFYGHFLEAQDNFEISTSSTLSALTFEECELKAGGAGSDQFNIGATSDFGINYTTFINSLLTLGGSPLTFRGNAQVDFFNCEFTSTRVGTMRGSSFVGRVRFFNCDFTGCNATLVDIAAIEVGEVEFWNCRMPSGHILTTGTATGLYTVVNYGSEDSTGLTTGGSEQALEIHTHQGTIDIETTVVRTGGATDLADGLFAYGVAANNVTDNFVGVEVPLADIWVEGDGTAKTYTVFIANSTASTDFQDNEVYLRLEFPSEAGVSMYDYLPDEGAPGDGGGRTQLLGTPADLTDDTDSTWGSGGNNHQKLIQSIAPGYEGLVRGTLIYSRSGADTLYSDSLPTVT